MLIIYINGIYWNTSVRKKKQTKEKRKEKELWNKIWLKNMFEKYRSIQSFITAQKIFI